MKLNPRSLLVAVITCSLALPGAVMADKRGHDRDYGRHNDRHQSRHYDRHKYRHHDRHYDRGHRHGYTTHYYRYDNDDDLLVGLLFGGLVGYALGGAQSANSYPAPQAYRNAYPATETYSEPEGVCLQEREYTTTVRIGGRDQEAYGTACLQPDGSWKRGPAELVSY